MSGPVSRFRRAIEGLSPAQLEELSEVAERIRGGRPRERTAAEAFREAAKLATVEAEDLRRRGFLYGEEFVAEEKALALEVFADRMRVLARQEDARGRR